MYKIKSKKNILIVADSPNWAYHHIALFVKKHFAKKYNIYIDFTCVYEKSDIKRKLSNIKIRIKYCKRRLSNKYDIVILLGFYFDRGINLPYKYNHIIKGIYTSTFPPQGAVREDWSLDKNQFLEKYFSNCDLIIAGSHDIVELYKNKEIPIKYCNAPTIDEDRFKAKFKETKSPGILTIGWTGNPNRKFKGFYDIILPAIDKIQEKYGNKVRFITRFKGPLETLIDFYNDVDLVLIASNGDAGPSLFWEASMCHIPCISTKNGWPAEVIIHQENGILCERTISDFYYWIDYIYNNRDILALFSRRIKNDTINKLGNQVNIDRWDDALESILSQK
ncbi:glycosyltransferase [Carboxylicivirga sediminis]|uniref:Glycosyltransferase n=1 Tax=Carboxylicivirga sediminis TaxID=2006564 RepID=A0A941IX64_9BACT|nr:glycosyltransferase [Carboxylicivirga sediminis]MBR8535740.1 glycosyltransferase [Carboxylicivirga sediminis]